MIGRSYQTDTFYLRWAVVCLLVALISSCSSVPEIKHLHGQTMGTYYSISYTIPLKNKSTHITSQEIEDKLNQLENIFSTWKSSSEISKFNKYKTNSWFKVSQETMHVIKTALAICKQTNRAFDISIAPLIKLWGFQKTPMPPVPSKKSIKKALKQVNCNKLVAHKTQNKIKKQSKIKLDVSGIAKGYAVDQIAQWLLSNNIKDFLVDIGGELKVSGKHPKRKNGWKVGIESPKLNSQEANNPNYTFLLSNNALATSGDYRNYRIIKGKRHSHIIDPKTGWPLQSNLSSVSVIASSTMRADAYATAISVMGITEGKKFIKKYDLAALLMSTENDKVTQWASPRWEELTNKASK